jgi:hypothetical protein
MKNHKILMEKDMKTLKGISLGPMYKKSEPEARMAGINAFIRKRLQATTIAYIRS